MRKRDKKIDEAIKGFAGLLFIILLSLWLTDKTKFYIYIAIIFLVAIIIIWVFLKIKKNKFNKVYSWHSSKDLLKKIQAMSPNEFEYYIADMYLRLGYKTEQVGGSYDGGIDVIATKNNIKHYIQCKKYITSKVGVSEVRDFYGAMAGKLSNGKGIFITTNIFTTEAENFAEDKPIELIDGDSLLKLIKLAKKENEIIKVEEINKCPNCGGELIEKNGKYGKFLGCSNYPKCKYTKNI